MDTWTLNPLWLAADLIRERGWTQNVIKNARGNLCAMGAINEATGACFNNAYEGRSEYCEVVKQVIKDHWPERVANEYTGSIAKFNDHRLTLEEDVLAALEKAAARFDEIH